MQYYVEVKKDFKRKEKIDFADYLLFFMHKGLIELFNLSLLQVFTYVGTLMIVKIVYIFNTIEVGSRKDTNPHQI